MANADHSFRTLAHSGTPRKRRRRPRSGWERGGDGAGQRPRAMMLFMISLDPPRIRRTRTSLYIWAIGYSVMYP